MSAAVATAGDRAERRAVPPPAEFVGRARQFRAALLEADTQTVTVIDAITAALSDRIRRNKPTFRPDKLIDIARQWETKVPAFGRLDLASERGKGTLFIRETRACTGRFRSGAWGADAQPEKDVGITVLELMIEPRRFEIVPPLPLASIGMHALSRWFQRAFLTTQDALLADLGEIARRHRPILDGSWDADFAIATVNGTWRGEVAIHDDGDRMNMVGCL